MSPIENGYANTNKIAYIDEDERVGDLSRYVFFYHAQCFL